MGKKEDRQTSLPEYETKPAQLTGEAYAILSAVKNQLITKHKKHFTISDAIIELKNRGKGCVVEFTKNEVAQIKSKIIPKK